VCFFIAFITLTLAILYGTLITYFNKGWTGLQPFVSDNSLPLSTAFSIIIPARNEQENIITCLEGIVNQKYPATQFEIIIMDDFSDDDTAGKVQEFIQKYPVYQVRIIKLSEENTAEKNSFKKFAITLGIKYSKYDWIITSDADCRHGHKWLATIASYIEKYNPVLVSAPVTFHEPSNFFEKTQALEFTGLIAIGAASMAQKPPNLCNGANLIYRKDVFYEVDGFKGFDDIASGDDEFLMHKIYVKYKTGVDFLKSRDAIAYTQATKTLPEFMQQRKRWVSKSGKYKNKGITAILIGAYFMHLFLLVCLIAGFIYPAYFIVFIMAFGIKLLAEYMFLSKVTKFFNQKSIINLIIPAAFLYIFYALIIGIYANFGRYEWKGRIVK